MYIPDLSYCTYDEFQKLFPSCIAIGWLGKEHEYNKTTDLLPEFIDALRKYIKKQSAIGPQFFGHHECEFCRKEEKKTKPLTREEWTEKYKNGDTWDGRWKSKKGEFKEKYHFNLIIHGENEDWACPELLLHYIVNHGYTPPLSFQKDVIKNVKE